MIRLEELRKKMGLSQEDLAKRINMTQQRISAYEKGKREPDLETLQLLAKYFGVSTDYLLGKTEIRNLLSQEDFEKNLLNSKFAEKYNKLTDEQRKTLDSLVEVWEKENKKEK